MGGNGPIDLIRRAPQPIAVIARDVVTYDIRIREPAIHTVIRPGQFTVILGHETIAASGGRFILDVHVEIRRRLPSEGNAAALGGDITRLKVGGEGGVAEVEIRVKAVLAVYVLGHSNGEMIRYGQIRCALRLGVSIVAEGLLDKTVDALECGPYGVDEDRSAGRILANQGSLRTTQYFDLAYVVVRVVYRRFVRNEEAIRIVGNAGRRRGIYGLQAHTADVDERKSLLILYVQRRRDASEVVQVRDAPRRQFRSRYHRRGDRDLIELLDPPLGRDDDLRQVVRLYRAVDLCRGDRFGQRGGGRRQGTQKP